jgi:hypothetical protein
MAADTKPFTATGNVLTDAAIAALADGAERGYDVEVWKSRRRRRPMLGTAAAEVVPVRPDPELQQAVEARAEAITQRASRPSAKPSAALLDVA